MRISRVLLVILLVALAGNAVRLSIDEAQQHFGFLIDDAYISLRYARNLAEGHGLVFNEGERVEGYTNFLWTLLEVPPFLLEIDPETWSQGMGVASAAALVVVLFLLGRQVAGVVPGLLLAAGLSFDPRSAAFSTWGLEILFYPSLYAAAFVLLFGRRLRSAGVLFAFAALCRMEGAMMFAVGALHVLVLGAVEGWSARELRDRSLRFALPFVAIFGSYFLGRWSYYGELLPNTFYAKVGHPLDAAARGVAYLNEMLGRMGLRPLAVVSVGAAPMVLAGLAWWSVRARQHREKTWDGARVERRVRGMTMLVAGIGYALYTVSVGGDHFGERFVYHALPVLLLGMVAVWGFAGEVVGSAIRRFADGPGSASRRRAHFLAATAASLSIAWALVSHPHHFDDFDVVSGWASLGEYLRGNAPAGASLATDAAGAIPFYSRMPTIDILGLNDHHIAHRRVPDLGLGTAGHEKSDPQYVLNRQPLYITTWIDPRGRLTRGFESFFDFRTGYEMFAVLDLRRGTLDTARVRVVDPGASSEERENAVRASDDTFAWALMRRRGVAGTAVQLTREDFRSRLFDPLPEIRDGLLVAPVGHEPGHVIFGPYMRFRQGRYRWSVETRFADVDATAEPLAIFESVLSGTAGDHVLDRIEIREENLREGMLTLDSEFSISRDREAREVSLRLWCSGHAEVSVKSVRVEVVSSGRDGPSPDAPARASDRGS